ncbi:hypothetical protein IK110_01210 [Candidatus Saccharibacteria bacterium]|nr:hypothetical protein [Candidatus Saccharibacteria bacterium]
MSFFRADTSKFKFEYSKLEESEIEAANLLIKLLKPKEVIRIPEVKIPERIKTPDFTIDGITYEIKAPKSVEQISRRMCEAMRQIRSNGFIVLDARNCERAIKTFVREAVLVAKQHKVTRFYLVYKHSISLVGIKK